ncbi:MAG: hypothetical protein D6732_18095 [Methanobacteriota archaeon]|nr:MAG: hypothetical protein D6732_18095 [Euryarchaeota archaeon]
MNSKFNWFLVAFMSIVMSACAQHKEIHQEHRTDTEKDYVLMMIGQAVKDAVRAQSVLARVNNADKLDHLDSEKIRHETWQSSYVPEGLDKKVSVRWAGPLHVFVRDVATRMLSDTEWKFRILGKVLKPDVYIMVDAHDMPVVDVLRDVGLQAGDMATIRIVDASKIIEVRYNAQ